MVDASSKMSHQISDRIHNFRSLSRLEEVIKPNPNFSFISNGTKIKKLIPATDFVKLTTLNITDVILLKYFLSGIKYFDGKTDTRPD
jgi:hypothetical protein